MYSAAQEAGAVGVLIYSDPGDDGEYTEEHGFKAYPDGPARQVSSLTPGLCEQVNQADQHSPAASNVEVSNSYVT